MREVMNSIKYSCKSAIEKKIDHLGFGPQFTKSTHQELRHANGGICFFQGMSNVTEESIRGLEDIDVLWFEEAQAMSRRSWEILEPTIRANHSEIWLTFNPRERTDPVWELKEYFEQFPQKNVLVFKTNWHRNAFFTKENEESRLRMKVQNPERYAHVWLGEPDDGATARKLLPYGDLLQVTKKKETSGHIYAGLDIADTGQDRNALVIRQGPCIIYHERWSGVRINDTVRRAVRICTEMGVAKLYFDETGLGAGAGSKLIDLKREGKLGFMFEGVNFGSGVRNPRKVWGMQGHKPVRQNDRYERRTSQLGDTLRMRLHASLARLRGNENVPEENCLWIDPNIKDRRQLLTNLSQPEENETVSGKMTIVKQPKPEGATAKPPSPDSYDAAILAFATDSNFGVTKSAWAS